MEVKPVHLHLLLQIRACYRTAGTKGLSWYVQLPPTPARASLGGGYSLWGTPEEHEINQSFDLSLLPAQPAYPDFQFWAWLSELLWASSEHEAASGKKHIGIPHWETLSVSFLSLNQATLWGIRCLPHRDRLQRDVYHAFARCLEDSSNKSLNYSGDKIHHKLGGVV